MCGLQKLENKETDFSQAIQQGILTYKTKDELRDIQIGSFVRMKK